MDPLTTIAAAWCPSCGSAEVIPTVGEAELVCACGEVFAPAGA